MKKAYMKPSTLVVTVHTESLLDTDSSGIYSGEVFGGKENGTVEEDDLTAAGQGLWDEAPAHGSIWDE